MVARLVISIVIISIVISVISTSLLIYSTYQENDQLFAAQLNDIKKKNRPALASAIWYFDQIQINTHGEWVSSLPHIDYVKIATTEEKLFEKGSFKNITESNLLTIPLNYNNKIVGKLELGVSRETNLTDLIQTASKAIAIQLISAVFLTMFLIWGVYRFITCHLEGINQQLKSKLSNGKYQHLKLERLSMNRELAPNESTLSLQASLNELNSTLDHLIDTQTQLIESEKLSSLAVLVAGIAHEVKTPVGLCITTHSFIKDLFQDLQKHVNDGNISKESFADYMVNMEECVDILSKNLARTSTLVESFKHVSEDQAGEILRSFNLAEYLGEILSTLSPKLKTSSHSVQINCPDNITLTSYLGALSQVIINLIMNSLMHGFEGITRGNIIIQAEQIAGKVIITYSDDGFGMSKEVEENLFTAFFTTKQGSGGTGLGMHLVKTIIEQTLQGSIKVQPCAKGCTFVITISDSIT